MLSDKITFDEIIRKLSTLPSREIQSPTERKFFSDISSALLNSHLELLINEKDWVAGIILAAAMLDFAGKTRLLWKENITSASGLKKIEEMKFEAVIKRLLKDGIVDTTAFAEMNKIRHARNSAAHDVTHQVALSLRKESNAAIEGQIRSAMILLRQLFSI